MPLENRAAGSSCARGSATIREIHPAARTAGADHRPVARTHRGRSAGTRWPVTKSVPRGSMVQFGLDRRSRPGDFRSVSRPNRCRMNFGITELLIILVIAVVIFGANRLPELGRGIGKGIRNFKDATRDAAEEGTKSTSEKS